MPSKNVVIGQKITSEKAGRAKELRREMTLAEQRLWQQLRANRLDEWHFRRQQIIAGFIVDFYCHRAGLVIEVDGSIHEEQIEADAERDRILKARGLTVLRYTNRQVMNDMSTVIRGIRACLTPPLPVSGRGRGRGRKNKVPKGGNHTLRNRTRSVMTINKRENTG